MKCQISVSAPNRKHPESVVRGVEAVSYTHLDVYKRQVVGEKPSFSRLLAFS